MILYLFHHYTCSLNRSLAIHIFSNNSKIIFIILLLPISRVKSQVLKNCLCSIVTPWGFWSYPHVVWWPASEVASINNYYPPSEPRDNDNLEQVLESHRRSQFTLANFQIVARLLQSVKIPHGLMKDCQINKRLYSRCEQEKWNRKGQVVIPSLKVTSLIEWMCKNLKELVIR